MTGEDVVIVHRGMDLASGRDFTGFVIQEPPSLRKAMKRMRRFAKRLLIEAERPRVPLPSIRSERIDRNKPCPCGSGIKAKKCCP